MPKLFWPNFDFEHELAAESSWTSPSHLQQLNAKFAPVLKALCNEEDLIVLPTASKSIERIMGTLALPLHLIDESVVRDSQEYLGPEWELIPWGVTKSLERLAQTRGWTWKHPQIDVVRKWNDRLTSVAWEQRTSTAPEGLTIIEAEHDLLSALSHLPTGRWVIKARYGMSARERIVSVGSSLSDSQRGWLKKRIDSQGAVVLEPWLESVEEAGLQFEIPPQGPPLLVAVLPLLNSSTGEYRGSRLRLTKEEKLRWQPAVEIGLQIATDAQSGGYFGPLGIDAMWYRDGDKTRLRPVQEINARWTMGRIAWEWGPRVSSPEDATWLIEDVIR